MQCCLARCHGGLLALTLKFDLVLGLGVRQEDDVLSRQSEDSGGNTDTLASTRAARRRNTPDNAAKDSHASRGQTMISRFLADGHSAAATQHVELAT